MNNLKTFKSFESINYKSPISIANATIDDLPKYESNPENFPKNELIKKIFVEISDLCYIQNCLFQLKNSINRIDTNNNFQNISSDIRYQLNLENFTYYNSYLINIGGIFIDNGSGNTDGIFVVSGNADFNQKLSIALQRLKNFGFEFSIYTDVRYKTSDRLDKKEYVRVYIVDTDDPVDLNKIFTWK